MTNTDSCDLSIVGRIVTASDDIASGEVRVVDGVICEVLHSVSDLPYRHREHLGDRILFPGFVDTHVHIGTTKIDGLARTTRAAALGGVTCLVDMPFDIDGVVNSGSQIEQKRTRFERESLIDVALLATVDPNAPIEQIEEIAESGACGVVISLFEQDPIRYPKIGLDALSQLLHAASKWDLVVSMHAETDELIKPLIERLRNSDRPEDWRSHEMTRPPVSESHAVLTGLELARDAGARLHVHQVSLERSHSLARHYRSEGLAVTTETLLHHLLLSSGDVQRLGARAKFNPPLRSDSNQEDLWRALSAGDIAVVASDHTPWPKSSKSSDKFLDNASGAPSIDIYASLLIGAALRRGVPVSRIAQTTALRPAEIFGLSARKGDISAGRDADFLIFDPNREWIVDPQSSLSQTQWSPYDGTRQIGKVVKVFQRGALLAEEEEPASDSRGQVLTRNAPALKRVDAAKGVAPHVG